MKYLQNIILQDLKQPKCTLCKFCDYFPDAKIENMPIKNFLEENYNKKDQLNKVVNLMKPFFDQVQSEDKGSLQFFNKEYYWHSRDIATGTIQYVTLDQIINQENGKWKMVLNQLLNGLFLKLMKIKKQLKNLIMILCS